MWRALIWKEWRDCRWKMLVVTIAYLALALAARLFVKTGALGLLQMGTLALAGCVAGFLAMITLTEEHARNTYDTLRAVPVRPQSVFLIRCAWGLITLAAPLVLVELLSWTIFDQMSKPLPEYTLSQWLLTSILFSWSLYAWTVGLVAGTRSELKVALGALLIVSINFVLLNVLQSFPFDTLAYFSIRDLIYASPLASFSARLSTLTLLFQCAAVISLIALGAWRAGRTHASAGRRTVATMARGAASLGKNWTAPRYPIFWKTWREIGRLCTWCTLGSVIALAADGYFYWLSRIMNDNLGHGLNLFVIGRLYGIPEAVTMLLLLVTLLTGTALGTADRSRGLDFFWRSRPIDARRYLLTRMAIGAMMTFLMMFAVGVTMGYIFQWLKELMPYRYDNSQVSGVWQTVFRPMIVVPMAELMAVVFLASFALSNFLRRRVLAMILVATLVIGYEMLYGNGTLQLSSLQNWDRGIGQPFCIPLETLLWLVVGSVIAALTIAAHEGRWRDRIEDWIVRTMSREERVS